jgi:hypothetical protein
MGGVLLQRVAGAAELCTPSNMDEARRNRRADATSSHPFQQQSVQLFIT